MELKEILFWLIIFWCVLGVDFYLCSKLGIYLIDSVIIVGNVVNKIYRIDFLFICLILFYILILLYCKNVK